MTFLPAGLIAVSRGFTCGTIVPNHNCLKGIFGMNVKEINTGALQTFVHYVEATVGFTVFTVYIVITLQTHSAFHRKKAKLWTRAAWPVLLPFVAWRWILEERNRDKQRRKPMTAGDNV